MPKLRRRSKSYLRADEVLNAMMCHLAPCLCVLHAFDYVEGVFVLADEPRSLTEAGHAAAFMVPEVVQREARELREDLRHPDNPLGLVAWAQAVRDRVEVAGLATAHAFQELQAGRGEEEVADRFGAAYRVLAGIMEEWHEKRAEWCPDPEEEE